MKGRGKYLFAIHGFEARARGRGRRTSWRWWRQRSPTSTLPFSSFAHLLLPSPFSSKLPVSHHLIDFCLFDFTHPPTSLRNESLPFTAWVRMGPFYPLFLLSGELIVRVCFWHPFNFFSRLLSLILIFFPKITSHTHPFCVIFLCFFFYFLKI